jgi:hypothetical protein
MWLRARLIRLLICAQVLFPALLAAEERTGAKSSWDYGIFLDAAYGLNFNFPENHQWRSKETTPRTNELAPNMGLVYLRKEPSHQSRWGAELGLQAGYDTNELVPEEDPTGGADVLRHLSRANVSYLAPIGTGLELTAGLMKASLTTSRSTAGTTSTIPARILPITTPISCLRSAAVTR